MTASDAGRTVKWAIRRHYLAVRAVLVVALMLALAGAVNAVWYTALANVVAGLLVVFSGALVLVMLIVGASMGLHRMRRGRAG